MKTRLFGQLNYIVIFLGLGIFLSCTKTVEIGKSIIIGKKIDCTEYYNKGVNDALQTIILHDLELSLKYKNMTWGERADTVRARLNVPIKGKGGKI